MKSLPSKPDTSSPHSLESTLQMLPKVELHLHLEGAIPIAALWNLIEKYGRPDGIQTMSDLQQKFQYTDFRNFIETWSWKNNFLREYEDFTFIASEVAADLAQQNIVYVEAFFSPGDFTRHGLDPQKLTEAVRKGLDVHKEKIQTNLVADLIRDFGPQKGMRWLHALGEVKSLGVVGIGIGGSEQEFPPEPYEEVFEQARKLGFRTSAHAGEAAGPKSVWGAVNILKVDRIGHGTRAAEDPDLVAFLKENQIPLEMCPISNLRTGIVSDISSHPIKSFFDSGLMVTVNTDDPKMFNTSLQEEYLALINDLDFTISQVKTLISNAIRASWCDSDTKAMLTENLSDVYAHSASDLENQF